jgi:hypothetical protein
MKKIRKIEGKEMGGRKKQKKRKGEREKIEREVKWKVYVHEGERDGKKVKK